MALATVVDAWTDGTTVYLWVVLANPDHNVEVTGTTPLHNDQGAVKPLAQLRTECIADIREQVFPAGPTRTSVAITGTVDV